LKCRAVAGGIVFPIYVHPSSKDESIRATDEIEVFTRAPAEGNKANMAVIKMLSKALGIPRKNITIIRGSASRTKEIYIASMTPEIIEQTLRKG
jgi:uncharacterized protein (TIGR00251 family)